MNTSAALPELWIYLSRQPLTALTGTILCWILALRLSQMLPRFPLANPVLIAAAGLALGLLLTGVDYQTYFGGAQFIHFLLGPATVALAIPLYRQWQVLKTSLGAVLVSVSVGGLVAAGCGSALAAMTGASPAVVASLAARSVTVPVALGVSEQIGGIPSLTAAMVMASGIAGAVLGPSLLTLLRVSDHRARGLAIGTAAHGLGTARALAEHPTTGAFSGLAMVLIFAEI